MYRARSPPSVTRQCQLSVTTLCTDIPPAANGLSHNRAETINLARHAPISLHQVHTTQMQAHSKEMIPCSGDRWAPRTGILHHDGEVLVRHEHIPKLNDVGVPRAHVLILVQQRRWIQTTTQHSSVLPHWRRP